MTANTLFQHPYLIAISLFSIYFANIIIGKLSLLITERSLPLSLSGVVEFILLFIACIFFVIGILQDEASRQA